MSCPREAISFESRLAGPHHQAIFFADRFGLVALIAKGYRALAWMFLIVYVLPLMTWGVWRLARNRAAPAAAA